MDAAQDAMIFTRLAIGAMSVGGMKRCLQLMHRYATRRSIATGSLIDNPVTLARLSDLTAATTALETLVARISELLDQGCSVPVEAFIACKTSGPEFLWKAVDSLVQLLGGRGYIETNIAPQLLRDARIFRIFEVRLKR
jgi:alkylation response protein AidB-like acyl-CoA dehydrogenase